MSLKKRISMIISLALVFNIFSIFPSAIVSKSSEKANTKVPINEWYLPNTNTVYTEFYNAVNKYLPQKDINNLTDADFKDFVLDLDLPEGLIGLPPVINRFTNVQSIRINKPHFTQAYMPDKLFEEEMPNLIDFILIGDENQKVDIETLPDNFLQNAKFLFLLKISNTNMVKLPENILKRSTDMASVVITNNPRLKKVPDHFLVNTQTTMSAVDLSNNALESLPEKFLSNVGDVFHGQGFPGINLSNNNLIKIPDQIGSNFSQQNLKIPTLDISNNQVLEYSPNFNISTKYISNKNLFRPTRDDNGNFDYYTLSPKLEFYNKEIKFEVNKAISSQELLELLGNEALLNDSTGERKNILPSHELKFVPSNEYASMFDASGMPIKTGAVQGYIEFSKRPSGSTNLKTDIITVQITDPSDASDSTLKNLNLENATLYPSFSPDVISYSAILKPGISNSNIIATPSNSNADVSGNIGDINFNKDKTEIKVNVVSQDKKSSTTYTIIVEKTSQNENDTTLSALDIGNSISLTDFSKTKTEYEVNVANDKTFVEINPTPNDAKARLQSNDINKKLHLLEGENIFTFKVIAPNSTDSKLYKIKVTRASSTVTTDNAALTNLEVEGKQLMPNFSADVTQYILNVDKNTDQIKVKAAGVANSVVKINGTQAAESNVSLNIGTNVVKVEVTAAEGYSREYTINVNRSGLSNDATLSSLTVTVGNSNKTLNPVFNANTNEYTVTDTLSASDPNPVINAVAKNAGARVYGAGYINNFTGTQDKNVAIPITVVAEDGVTTNVYKINIKKSGGTASTDTSLKSLSLTNMNGAEWFTPFASGADTFEVVVPFETDSTAILAQTTDITATINSSDLATKQLNVGKNEFKIQVTAGDATTVKEYTLIITRKSINMPASSDNTLLFIGIAGQTLNPTFSSDIENYTLNVDNAVNTIDISTIKSSYYANVNMVKTRSQNLAEGDNKFSITVTAQDQSTKVYTITVNRAPTVNANLSLSGITISSTDTSNVVTNHNISPTFNTNITNYNVEVPYDVTEITINATPTDATTTVTGTGVKTLTTGNNKFDITVTDQGAANTLVYTLNVLRGPSKNTSLTNIEIKDSSNNNIAITPSFNANTFEYSAEVESNVDKINIQATTDDNKATIRGTLTNINLNKGLNVITLTVIAEDGVTTKDTIIRVTRKKSSEALLESLEIKDSNNNIIPITPAFNENTTTYSASAPAEDIKITISATAKGSATIDPNYLGVKSIASGQNTFDIKVVAEDGTTEKTYTVNVNRPQSTNSELSSLIVRDYETGNEITLNPTFNPQTHSYNVDIGNYYFITIEATPKSKSSTVTGTGEFTIKGSSNQHVVKVIAENQSETSYTLNITKNASSNNNLSMLVVQGAKLSPTFDKNTLEYNVNVPAGTTKAKIIAQAEDRFATVSGDGEVSLTNGKNVVEVTVTAEDGTTKIYKININVLPSDDANLSKLEVKNNGTPLTLSPTFSADVTSYTATVGPTVDKVTIEATANSLNATVTGDTGERNLQTGPQKFTVTVTAEDGQTTKNYEITVTKSTSSDSTLSNLVVTASGSPQTLDPVFSSNVKNYRVDVPNNISSVNITATPNHQNATVSGSINTQSLNVGENRFAIIVTAEDKTTSTYEVVVNRAKSTDATLQSLKVLANGKDLITSFTPGNYNYTLTVDNNITSVDIQAIVNTQGATITGDVGSRNIQVGENDFTITVTAQDGTTVQNYKIKIKRAASTDATLSNITVTSNGTTLALDQAFDPTKTTYTVQVGNEITDIDIAATKNHAGATITGDGNQKVNVGNNNFPINVTAEDGTTVKTYTIIVIRAASNDSTLKSLKVLVAGAEQTLSPAFSPTTKEYTLTLANSVTEVELSAAANHANASITGNGTKTLNVGENTFTIEVTAEDTNTKSVYKVKITRLASDDATLRDLKVSVNGADQTLNPNFASNQTSYKLDVANNVTNADITATASHNSAQVSGDIGNVQLKVGENRFVVLVTAPDKLSTLSYTIIINRAPSTNASLSELKVSSNGTDYPLNPQFSSSTTKYNLTLPNDISRINIKAVAADNTASITGNYGDFDLKVGVNTFVIDVTAQDGVTKTTYTIEITRLASSNANLASLEILLNGSPQMLVPNFSSPQTAYTVHVPEGTKQIEVKATTEDSTATITGNTGIQNIQAGTNNLTITVTAQDKTTKNYTINVNRPVSTNSSLSSLELSSNGNIINLNPGFSSAVNSYTAEVPNDISNLKISAVPGFAGATLSGDLGSVNLNVGVNTLTIKVVAEDGKSTSTYTIEVTRLKSNDATLSSLILKTKSGEIINLTPSFDPNTESYLTKVINSVDELSIEATTSNSNATINAADTGMKTLKVGDNTFKVTITAEDGTTTKSYNISVKRSEQIKDIIINGLPTTNKIEMNVNQATDLEFNFAPFDSFDNIKVTSSNPNVAVMELFQKNKSTGEITRASVYNSDIQLFGRINTLSEGNTTITVESSDGKIVKVFDIMVSKSVTKPNVPVIDLNPQIPEEIPSEQIIPNNTATNNPVTSDSTKIYSVVFLLIVSSLVLVGVKRRNAKRKDESDENESK